MGEATFLRRQGDTTFAHIIYLRYWLSILCWLMVISTSSSNAAKILILPGCAYSTCRTHAAIGEELIKRKHNVSIFVIESLDFSKCTPSTEMYRITVHSPAGAKVDNMVKEILRSVSEKRAFGNKLNMFKHLPAIVNASCSALLGDATLIDKLRDEHFDIALVDGEYVFQCYFLLPYILNVPYISVSNHYLNFVTGQPFTPSIYPLGALEYTDKMALTQRMFNAIFSVIMSLVPPMLIPMDVIKDIAPTMTAWDVCNLASQAELFLENKDHLLDFAKPLPDGHIMVGGLTASPAKPLPRDLQRFMDGAKHGVIIVSFGSVLESLPQYISEKLSLSLQKQSAAIIWKRNGETEFTKMKFVQWFPQNDLLGHRKVKLFISHCGNNGMYEALYHGVPILCVPIMNDQFANALSVKTRKYGLTANLIDDSQEELDNTLNEMMTNRIYEDNIKLASKIFHSREHGPRQRATFWIEHVIKYGGKHLRSRALDIPVYQYIHVDIYAILASVVCIISYICYRLIHLIIKSCYVKLVNRKVKHD